MTVGSWIVGRALGRGGMAVVHEVRHAELGTRSALKVLNSVEPKIRARLLREGRAQARLDHPNIVRVTDVLEVDGRAALLMEYVDGPDLAGWVRSEPRSVDELLAVIRTIGRALVEAHRAGIVHRDLKPGNVLVAPGPTPKITDFGIAKVFEEQTDESMQTRSGMALGTPVYMPPEQIRSARDIDHRADVYALGVLAYELLAGARPYAPSQDLVKLYQDAMAAAYEPLDARRPGLPAHVVAAVHGAMRGDANLRIPDVQTFLDVLDGKRDAPEGVEANTMVDDLEPSDLHARYTIDQALSLASWRARDASGRTVHVRGLNLDEASDEARALFEREVAVLGQLDHPAIPRLIEVFDGSHGGARHRFRVRAWVEGRSLDEERQSKRYTEAEVLAVLEEVAGVLAHLHGLSPPILLRDLSPGNLVRRPDGGLSIIDLGRVRDAAPGTLGGQTIVGSFGYMAPEQFEGDASPATDTYGLGALAVALLGRKDPAELMDDARNFRWRDTVRASAPVDTLLGGLLEPEPADRVADAKEALRAVRRARKALVTLAERPAEPLESLREHLPPVPYEGAKAPVPVGPHEASRPSSAPLFALTVLAATVIAAVALVGAVALGGVVIVADRPAPPPATSGAAPTPSAERLGMRYQDPPSTAGAIPVHWEVKTLGNSGVVEIGYSVRNGTSDWLVIPRRATARVGGEEISASPDSLPIASVAVPPGASERQVLSFYDPAVLDRQPIEFTPPVLRLAAGDALTTSVTLARHMEIDDLSCVAATTERLGDELLTGLSCTWSGSDWLQIAPSKARLDGKMAFRQPSFAVAPGEQFELSTPPVSEKTAPLFDGTRVIDLEGVFTRATASPAGLPSVTLEARK